MLKKGCEGMEKSTFGKRLGDIMQNNGITRGALKNKTGISLQSIGNYLNDKRKPDCEMVTEIAKALDVSADYLLGLSDTPLRNETVQGVHKVTGLWGRAIVKLHTEKCCGDDEIADFISYLVVNEQISNLVKQIKDKNRFASNPKFITIDVDGENYSTDMQAIFKMIVSDLFFDIIDGYTAEPGEIMLDYRAGESNG